MYNLFHLLQDLKVPNIEPLVLVEAIDENSTEVKEQITYQLQLTIESDE